MRNISSSSNRRSISKKKFINDSWKQNFINEIINTTEQEEEYFSNKNIHTDYNNYNHPFYPIKEVRADPKNEWFHKSYKHKSPTLNYTKYNTNPRMPQEYYYGYDNPPKKHKLNAGYVDNKNYQQEYRGSLNNREEQQGTTIINNYYGINPDDFISKNPYNSYNYQNNQSKYYIDKQEDSDVIDASVFANINKKEGLFQRLKNVFIPNSANSNKMKPQLAAQDYSANRHNRRLARIKERYVEKQARKTNNPNVYLVD